MGYQQVCLTNRGWDLACVIKTKILPDSVVIMSQDYRVMFKESFTVTFSRVPCDLLV